MLPVETKFMNIKITLLDREGLKEYIINSLYEKRVFRILLLNEKKLFQSFFSKELRSIINNSEIVLSSSRMVSWAVSFLKGNKVPIILPVTVCLDILRIAEDIDATIYLFGGSQKVAINTYNRLRLSFQKARIIGYHSSKLNKKNFDKVLTNIRKSSPKFLLASLGNGAKQEKWLKKYSNFYKDSIVVGVDDSFKILAGKKNMPPLWFQERNLNGLYYILLEPHNIFRLFRLFFIFIVVILRKLINRP